MANDVRKDALRLLRAVDEYQAEGRVGFTVMPEAVAEEAGLEPGSDRYNAAAQYLIDEGALEEDERYRRIASGNHPGGNLYFKMTQRGLEMLRE